MKQLLVARWLTSNYYLHFGTTRNMTYTDQTLVWDTEWECSTDSKIGKEILTSETMHWNSANQLKAVESTERDFAAGKILVKVEVDRKLISRLSSRNLRLRSNVSEYFPASPLLSLFLPCSEVCLINWNSCKLWMNNYLFVIRLLSLIVTLRKERMGWARELGDFFSNKYYNLCSYLSPLL